MSDAIVNTARAIGTLLAPLMGTRAKGKVVAKATSTPVFVPRNAVLIPTLHGDRRDIGLLRVASKPGIGRNDPDGWTVTSAGTEIDVIAAFGGVGGNLAGGNVCRWESPVPGLQPTVTVSPAGITGGVDTTGLARLCGFHVFEEIGDAERWNDLMKAGAAHFPAAVLFWVDSVPADGVVSPRTARDGVRMGRGRQLFTDTWTLQIYTSRMDSDPERRREGLTILRAASEFLTDRQSVDGIDVSPNPGLTIQRLYRVTRPDPRWYVYAIDFATTATLARCDEREWKPWLTTSLTVEAPAPSGSNQPPYPTVDDNVFGMT